MKTRSLELVSGNTVIKAEVTFDECHYSVRFDEFQTEDRMKTNNLDLAEILAADVSRLLEEKLEMGFVELHEREDQHQEGQDRKSFLLKLSPSSFKHLKTLSGSQSQLDLESIYFLNLNGLETVTDSEAEFLGQHIGFLCLDSLPSLTYIQAVSLSKTERRPCVGWYQ